MALNIRSPRETNFIRLLESGSNLRIENVSKRFASKQVLDHIDLEAPPGEFIALVGKSGCGKSTLLRLIAGLDKPSSGAIKLDGAAIRGPSADLRMMFQDARLLPWKRVLHNVGLGLGREWREPAERALEQVGLADRGVEWPAILSGGQKQRVALARALASAPHLLLLDEPLGALDALTRLEMQTLIETLWLERQFTTVLVTHDVEEAVALADRVVLMEAGKIVFDQEIDLPRPRTRTSYAFTSLRESILDRLMGRELPRREQGDVARATS